MAQLTTEEALRHYGLSEKETKVYLAILRLGSATVQAIAEKADVHRTTTYDVLKGLLEQGLVGSVTKRKTQYFEVAPPQKLVSILEEKKERITGVLHQLESLRSIVTEKPNVEFYEGREGIKTVMEDMLKEGKELCAISSTKDIHTVLQFYFPLFIRKRVERRIMIRVLTERNRETELLKARDAQELRQLRFLPDKTEIPTATYLYADKTAIFSLAEEPIAVLIENKAITQTQKILFELHWRQATP